MGDNLNMEKHPFPTAVNKILLGIYDEKFNTKYSNLDLGRFFLRIAWLFRENSGDSDSEGNQLSRHAMRIEDIILKLGRLYERIREEITVFEKSSKDFLSDPLFPENDKKATLTENYSEALSRFGIVLEEYKGAVVILKSSITVGSEAMSSYSSSVAPLDRPFGKYSSYKEFLCALKAKWPEVPVSEQEAMNHAAGYYKAAYEKGNEISAGNQAIQAVYLIAELSRRIKKHEEAKRYFNTSIKLAQEYIRQNKGDKSRTALAHKVLELALEQGKSNLRALDQKTHVPA